MKQVFHLLRYSLLLLIGGAVPTAFAAGQIPAGRQSVSHHQGVFNGVSVAYTATVKEDMLFQEGGQPVASIITTSYTADQPAEAGRPVLFIFNGGPGASSSPLHMHALGPKRIILNQDNQTALGDNPFSPLDVADLVFVDPVGTGYTRVIDSVGAARYWEVQQDAQTVIDVIKSWKTIHQRENAPVFLCGESYGTTRAAAMLGLADDLPLAGVLLLSTVVDFGAVAFVPGNEIPYLLYVPSMACTAWYHGKAGRRSQTVEEVYREAVRFAQTEYAPALFAGNGLPEKARQRMAGQLSRRIGLPPQLILKKNLRIPLQDFMLQLLAGEGKRTGRLNGQITGPLDAPPARPPWDDPSMRSGPPTKPAIDHYFTDSLHFAGEGGYTTLNLQVNAKWQWFANVDDIGYWSVAAGIGKAMKAQPGLRLFVAGGYYDLATPLFAGKYSLDHAGIPLGRVTFADFPTGHSVFEKEESLAAFTQKVRSFIREKP